MEERGFVFQPSFRKVINMAEEGDQLALFWAIANYGCCGEEPQLPNNLMMAFEGMRPNIDSALRKYTDARENGKKGGRPKKTPENLKVSEEKTPENLNKNIDTTITINTTIDKTNNTDKAMAASESDHTVFEEESREYKGALFLSDILKKAGKMTPSKTQLQWWAGDLRNLAKSMAAEENITEAEAMDIVCDTMMFASKDMYWSKALNDGYHFINAFDTIRKQMEDDDG